MSDSTLTRYLKLKVAADLSADAKYNLNRIDSLGFLATVNDDDSLNLVARSSIKIEPNSADVGGTGLGGSISLGTTIHPVEVTAYVSSFLVKAGFKLANQASTATNSLKLDFNSATDLATDRTLTIDVNGGNRSLTIKDSGQIVTIDPVSGNNSSIKSIIGLTTALAVGQGGTGYNGLANSSTALNNLVPSYNPATDSGKILSIKAGITPELEWRSGGGGTLTNVGLTVPSDILSVSNSPLTGNGGTISVGKVAQSAKNVFIGPQTGAASEPTFRLLEKTDLPALTTDDVTEGTSQYFTPARAQTAVVVQTLVAGDLTHAPSSDRILTLLAGKEPTITAGTSSQYWRGDKSWQTLDTAAISGLSTALAAKYDATNPASYVDASGAKTAAVINSTAGSETDQAASVSAMKSYVSSSTAAGTYSTSWTNVVGPASKTVTHSLNSSTVIVSVYDSADGKQLQVDDVDIVDANNVTLTAYQYDTGLPKTWTVVVQK